MRRQGWNNKHYRELFLGSVYEITCPHCGNQHRFVISKNTVMLISGQTVYKLMKSNVYVAHKVGKKNLRNWKGGGGDGY
ncbi:MAG: hypothetical protein IJ516_05740 [Phascolarctobacterium sp.]|nr:hypothetical protein [Phascolarctobacterium sp.]